MIKNTILKFFLKAALRAHSFSYRVAGKLSIIIEPDGNHPKHRLMKYHDWFAERIQKDWDILDIGCGNGVLDYDIRSHCNSIVGIDIEEKNIEKAKGIHFKEGITYICSDATCYEFKRSFHAIILSNVLEHIENRVEFLKKVYLNQDKKNPPVLLLRVPMITRDWISLYKKEQGVEWRLDRTHYTEYTLEQIFDEMNKADLKVEQYDIQFGEFYGVIVSKKSDGAYSN